MLLGTYVPSRVALIRSNLSAAAPGATRLGDRSAGRVEPWIGAGRLDDLGEQVRQGGEDLLLADLGVEGEPDDQGGLAVGGRSHGGHAVEGAPQRLVGAVDLDGDLGVGIAGALALLD